MTEMIRATLTAPPGASTSDGYESGACNIGPAEIARRRQAGHVGLAAAIALGGALVAIDAPPLARLLVALPAGAAASGYLQAYLRFCAGYGSRGLYNFGELGTTKQVVDPAGRRRDRNRAQRIAIGSVAIGSLAGIIAVLLPV